MERVFEIYIKTSPERLWEAITDPEQRRKYTFGLNVESDYLEVDPPRRLVQTFSANWNDVVKAEGPSRVTWEIEPVGDDSCRLLVTHDELREGASDELYGGWMMVLSGLKTLVETGEPLTTPGSLLFAEAGSWEAV